MGIIRGFIRFYDTPRSKIMIFLGALVVMPLLQGLRRDLRLQEKSLNERTILLGQLELTAMLLNRQWVDEARKK